MINNISNIDISIIFKIFITIFIILYINSLFKKIIIKFGNKYQIKKSFINVIQNCTYLLINFIGLMLTLEILSIPVSSLIKTLGILTVGISIALQKIIINIVSGFFLLSYKPFSVGDYISSDSPKFKGTIINISLQFTILKHEDEIVIIPNNKLYESVISVKSEPLTTG